MRGSLFRNVAASWFVYGVSLVIGFFLMPYVVHTLGEGSYGAWVFINSVVSYAGLLYFGFGQTICRYVAKYHASEDWQKLNQVTSLVFAVYSAMAGVAMLLAVGLATTAPMIFDWGDHSLWEIRAMILVLGLNIAVGLIGSVFGGVLMGLRRFDLERSVSLTVDISRTVLIFWFLHREYGLLTIALVYLAVSVIENLGYLYLAYQLLPKLSVHIKHVNWAIFKECSSFSGFAFLNAIANQLIYATDTVVIGLMLGPAAIVPYFIAQRLCQYIRQPIEKIGVICLPTAGALSTQTDPKSLHELIAKGMGISLLLSGGMLIGALYFSPTLVRVWMGPAFGESSSVIGILLFAQIVSLPMGVMRSIMFGMGNVRLPAVVYLVEAVVNLVLSLILVQYLGIQGVAWGTAIPVVLFELGIILPIGMRLLKLDARFLWREIIGQQIVALLGLWAYCEFISRMYPQHHSWPALIVITAGGGLVLGSIWLLQRKGERWLLRRPVAAA